MKNRIITILILIAILLVQVMLQAPFLGEPLVRDEGVFGYIAQRMFLGELPYRDYFDHKPPGIYFIYAGIFKLLGDTQASIRVFTLFYNLLNTLAVIAVGYLLFGGAGGLLAGFIYALYSGGPFVQGTQAYTETFMVLPLLLALGAFLLGLRKNPAPWFFVAGFLSGTAVMLKQVALLNFLVLVLFAFYSREKLRQKLLGLFLGFLILPALGIFYFCSKGALPDFVDQILFYNLALINQSDWSWLAFLKVVLYENLILWVLSLGAGLFMVLKKHDLQTMLLGGWSIASLIGVFVGKYFFGHYFIQFMPALALLSSYALRLLWKWEKHWLVTLGMVVVLSGLFWLNLGHWLDYLSSTPTQISIKKYETWDFVIAPEVSKYVRTKTSPSDTIFVWGAEPEVYFYSQRKSASKFTYFYPLVFLGKESWKMRQSMLDDLQASQPKYMIMARPYLYYVPFFNMLKSEYKKDRNFIFWEVWKRKGK